MTVDSVGTEIRRWPGGRGHQAYHGTTSRANRAIGKPPEILIQRTRLILTALTISSTSSSTSSLIPVVHSSSLIRHCPSFRGIPGNRRSTSKAVSQLNHNGGDLRQIHGSDPSAARRLRHCLRPSSALSCVMSPKHWTMIGRPGQGVVVHPEDHLAMKYFGLFLLVTLVRGIAVPGAHRAHRRAGARGLPGAPPRRPAGRPAAPRRTASSGSWPRTCSRSSAIVLVFLIAGLFVGTRPGRLLSDRLERAVLYRVPGYLLVRGAVGNFPGLKRTRGRNPRWWRPTTAGPSPCWSSGCPRGSARSSCPTRPRPRAGPCGIVEASRVRPLDAPMLSLLACLTRSGAGAGELAGRALTDRVDGAGTPA